MESNIEEKDVLCVTTDERKINYKWEKDSTVIVQDPQLGVVSLTDIKEYEKKAYVLSHKVEAFLLEQFS